MNMAKMKGKLLKQWKVLERIADPSVTVKPPTLEQQVFNENMRTWFRLVNDVRIVGYENDPIHLRSVAATILHYGIDR